MIEPTVFDYAESQRLKKAGIEKAISYPFDEPVGRARLIAIYLAKRYGEVHADSLRNHLLQNEETKINIVDKLSDKAWGGIFSNCPKLKCVGYRKSHTVLSKGHIQGIWKLKEAHA